jgi:hypothetical protein
VLRIRDVYPGFRILIFTHPGSRISDPGFRIRKQQQKRGVKQIAVIPFYVATNFTKLKIILVFKTLKIKIWVNFQRIFTQKIVTKLSKIWVWDPGSGIRDPGSGKNLFRIPDKGIKKAPDHGSRSATMVVTVKF